MYCGCTSAFLWKCVYSASEGWSIRMLVCFLFIELLFPIKYNNEEQKCALRKKHKARNFMTQSSRNIIAGLHSRKNVK